MKQAQQDIQAVRDQRNQHTRKIIASNQPPSSVYEASDQQEILELVRTVWQRNNPDTEILHISLPVDSWERHTMWQWNKIEKAWVKRDFSKLPAWVVIDGESDLAYQYPLDVYRLHLQGDKLAASNLTVEGKPDNPYQLLHKSAVKP